LTNLRYRVRLRKSATNEEDEVLTLDRYNAYEENVTNIIEGGKNIKTGVPFDAAEVDKNLDLTFEEHFTFQNVKSRAFVDGTISQDVANIIYEALGESNER
jgi:hypothetical protein